MEHQPTPSSSERMAGIEWMRGVAAFGVICIHSGLAVHNHTTEAAATLRDRFNFAVPFFLILSFFFAIQAEMARPLTWHPWFRRYAGRLLIPFAFWSMLYLGLHVAKLSMHHETAEIQKLLVDDPAGLILSGGTSVALYFLPLLLCGLIFLHLSVPLIKRLSVLGLLVGFVAGITLHYLFDVYFREVSFQGLISAPINLGIGIIGNVLRCIPFVFMAAILNRCLLSPSRERSAPLILLGLIILVLLNSISFSLTESFRGLGAFLVAWGLSGVLILNPIASLVGRFSFGVYLVHQLFLELIQVSIPFNGTVGVGGTLLIAAVTFVVSMATVGIASRSGLFAARVFGLR